VDLAGAGSAHVKRRADRRPKEIPIAVKPVMDDCRCSSSAEKEAKLPDMWKSRHRAALRRDERAVRQGQQSARSHSSSKLTPLDASAPPPDAETAKQSISN